MPLQPSTKPRRSRRRVFVRWSKRVALMVFAFGVVSALVYAWLPKRVHVDVGVARRTPLAVEVAEEGQTRVRDRFVVLAPIAGTLRRIELDAGANIVSGAVIASIEPPKPALLDDRSRREANARLAAAVAHAGRAESAIARATVARDAAIREATRARQLAQRGAIPAAERERAEDVEQFAHRDLASAVSDRASARAEVAAARAVLGLGGSADSDRSVEVVAPASGRVLRVVRDSAGPIVAGAPLVELGDVGALEVVVDVLSSDAAQIRRGMPVAIDNWGGERSLSGTVRYVEPSAFTRISALGVEEQRVNVIVGIDQPPPTLGDGFRVEARIFTWRDENVLTIPASALFRDRGQWTVYAIERGRARKRPVQIGHRGRLDVEVLSGLIEGAVIVLHPSDRIGEGVRVTK